MMATTIIGITLFVTIFIVGVPGNILIVWVFARKPRKTNTAWLIISLAVVDLAGCLIAPVHLLRALGDGFINVCICKSSIFGSRLFSFSALYLTTCIAIDRYMAVCKPLTRQQKPVLVILVIIISIALSIFGNLQFAIYVKAVALGPVIKKCLYRGGPDWLDLSNEVFTTICFGIIFITCTCVYVRIYQAIRKQMKVRAAGRATGGGGGEAALRESNMATGFPVAGASTITTVAVAEDPTSHLRKESGQGDRVAKQKLDKSPHISRQSKERLMTRMLLGTYLILILSWIPSIILTNVPDKQVAVFRSKPSQGILVYLAYQLRTLNHIVNLFVYALLNKDFRKDCKEIFKKCFQRKSCACSSTS